MFSLFFFPVLPLFFLCRVICNNSDSDFDSGLRGCRLKNEGAGSTILSVMEKRNKGKARIQTELSLIFDKFFLHPHTLFLHSHIILLFHSCLSWNYINIPILIKPLAFPTGWLGHPVYIFWKWEPDAPPIRFTISKNCKPNGLVIRLCSHFQKKIQTGRPHPVLNPADRKILKFAVDSPSNPKLTTLIINITY